MGTVRSTSIEFGCPNYDGVRTSVPRPILSVLPACGLTLICMYVGR